MIRTLLVCFVILFGGYHAFCQARLLSGQVSAVGSGDPLAGVNVVIRGTTRGTSTDADGRYSIEVKDGEVLVFSFIGYQPVTLTPREGVSGDVSLTEDITTLDEVTIVSTGYETLPRERVTGSFTHLDESLVRRAVSTDILARMADVTSGLIFNRNIPNRENDISIRGTATLFSDMSPLIVVDNFPYDGDISTINPNDVESITVLKDAAAASIWGARAGNGVIVITTRRGESSSPRVFFNGNVTVAERPDLNYVPRMSAADFISLEEMLFAQGFYDAAENSSTHTAISPAVELMIGNRDGSIPDADYEAQLDALRKNNVWDDFEEFFYRPEVRQQYALSIEGNGAHNRYYFSVGTDRVAHQLVGNDDRRLTLNARNGWALLDDRLEISTGIYYTLRNATSNNAGTIATNVTSVQALYPYARLRDDEGRNLTTTHEYRQSFTEAAAASGLLDWSYVPLEEIALADNTVRGADYRLNAQIGWKAAPGLKGEVLYQYWSGSQRERDHYSLETWFARDLINRFTEVVPGGSFSHPVPVGGILDQQTRISQSHNARAQFTYEHSWGDHALNGVAGYEVRMRNSQGSRFRYYGYDDELATHQAAIDYVSFFPQYDRPSNLRIPSNAGQYATTDRYLSWFGNVAYSFRRRYTLSLSARKDQSNLFGVRSNQRGVPLWSAGAAWTASEESFFRPAWANYLRFRATYGYNGNVNKNVTALTTARRLGTDPYSGLPYGIVVNPPNEALRWERVHMINVGADFGFAGNALKGSIEFYRKRGLDLIGTIPYSPSTGISEFTGNTASTLGRGFDITLSARPLSQKLLWNVDVLTSHITEEVTAYELEASALSYTQNGSGSTEFFVPLEGRPLFAIYSFRWAGLDPSTGDPRGYVAGTPSTDYNAIIVNATPDSLIYHGPARPTWFGALRNTLAWKNLSVSFNISYRLGYWFRMRSLHYGSLLQGRVSHGDFARRWQNPGDENHTDVPSMPLSGSSNRDNMYLYSEALVERGDHIRLQDVRLGYQFNESRRMPFSVELYAYFSNPCILWKATRNDIDPDYPTLPPARSAALGIRLEL